MKKSDVDGAGILFYHEGRVLMIRRAPEMKTDPCLWDIPGGYADFDETPRETAEREAREELGPLPPFRILGAWHLGETFVTPYVLHVAIVQSPWVPTLSLEHIKHWWMNLQEVRLMPMDAALRRVVIRVLDPALSPRFDFRRPPKPYMDE